MNLTQGKILAASAFMALLFAGSATAAPTLRSAIQEGPTVAQDSDRVGNYQYMRDRRRGYDPRYQNPGTYYPEEKNRNSPYNRGNGQLHPRDQSVTNGVYQYDWETGNYDPNYRTPRSRYDGRVNRNDSRVYDASGNYDPRYDANGNYDRRYDQRNDPRYNNGQYTGQDRTINVGPLRIKY